MNFLSSCLRNTGRRWPLIPALVLAGFAVASRAADAPLLVEAMLDNAPAGAETRCSYTRTRIEDGKSRRERFHAGVVSSPWQLLEVNGREPTEGELRRYARKREDRERQHPLDFDLRDMVRPDHWKLHSESQVEAEYEFRLRPNEELDEALLDKVLGTLVVDKVRMQPVRITIENTEPAYVAPLVRIAEYVQEMRFEWDETIGAAVLTERETRLRGRALALKPLRQHKLVRYSDYLCGTAVAESG